MQRLRFGTATLIAVLALAAMSFAQSAQNGSPTASPQQSAPPASAGQPRGGTTAPGQQGTMPGSPGQQNPSGSQGQANAAAPSPAGVVAKQLADLLNLSDTQTSQVKDVLEDERGKLLSLRDDPTLSDDDKEAKLLVIRQNASDQIMSILTPEQRSRLVEAIRSRQQDEQQPGTQPPQRPPQPPAAQPPAQQPPVQQAPPPSSR